MNEVRSPDQDSNAVTGFRSGSLRETVAVRDLPRSFDREDDGALAHLAPEVVGDAID
jgi:hypothetical protein